MSKSAIDRMNSISEQGLCSGCGICQSIAGSSKIKVVKSMNGFERPVIIGDLDDATVDKIFQIEIRENKKNEEIILKVIIDLTLIGPFSYKFKIN